MSLLNRNLAGTSAAKREAEKALSDSEKMLSRQDSAVRALQGDRGNVLSGTGEEQDAQLAGMYIGNLGYGQGLSQTGEDIQRVKELQRQRTEGSDPISQAIKNQKSGEIARAQREAAASGVKTGAAMGSSNAISRKYDSDIAASLYGQQAQNIGAERSLASNTLAGQTSLMLGSKAEGTAANMPTAPQSSGVLGTVICTELYAQGYYDENVYNHDMKYGEWMRKYKPHVYVGYRVWADHVVKLMKKSKLVTRMVSVIAVPWAKNMAGESNALGAAVSFVGEPICGIIGKITISLRRVYARG